MELELKGERILTVLLECPLEICLERNRRRERAIPERAVRIVERV